MSLYSHHLLAQRMCVAGDYRGAMAQEKEAHNIFEKQVRCHGFVHFGLSNWTTLN